MTVCFQLTKKGETEPSTLVKVDEAICAHFGWPVHPQDYVYGWFDSIGFMLAMGDSWDKIRVELRLGSWNFQDERQAIVDFLEANYTTGSWWEPK